MGIDEVLSFAKLSFYISGSNIIVKRRVDGEWNEELFRGTIEDLHTDQNKDLHNRLDKMEVLALEADGNALLIGVGDEEAASL